MMFNFCVHLKFTININIAYMLLEPKLCMSIVCPNWRRQNFAQEGGPARGAGVTKFVLTKSSRSESHLADITLKAKLNKNYFLISGDFDGLTSS